MQDTHTHTHNTQHTTHNTHTHTKHTTHNTQHTTHTHTQSCKPSDIKESHAIFCTKYCTKLLGNKHYYYYYYCYCYHHHRHHHPCHYPYAGYLQIHTWKKNPCFGVHCAAAVLWLHYTLHVVLFPMFSVMHCTVHQHFPHYLSRAQYGCFM